MAVLSVLSSRQSRRNEISTLIAKIAGSLQGKEGEFVESIPRVICMRRRRSVIEVYTNIGPIYLRRAYRMTYSSFIHLHRKLYLGIKEAARVLRRYKAKGLKTDNNTPPPGPNGRISTSVRLACALRYFAGGSPYDIMSVYRVSHTIVLDSVWCVVEATNQLADFYIEYPKSHFEQKMIAKTISKCIERE
jgi:hypothetical protein